MKEYDDVIITGAGREVNLLNDASKGHENGRQSHRENDHYSEE